MRPKRIKSGPSDSSGLRPASAASGTSVTSEDRREGEEAGKRLRDHESGKQTPDGLKMADDKSM